MQPLVHAWRLRVSIRSLFNSFSFRARAPPFRPTQQATISGHRRVSVSLASSEQSLQVWRRAEQ